MNLPESLIHLYGEKTDGRARIFKATVLDVKHERGEMVGHILCKQVRVRVTKTPRADVWIGRVKR